MVSVSLYEDDASRSQSVCATYDQRPSIADACYTSVLCHGRLIKLNNMRASEELSADDKRQLEFDLESNYTAFRGWLDSP